MLNIFNHLAKGTENPISVLLKLPANSEHVMMLRIPYSEPIFQYGPKFSENTWWYSLTYYHRNVLVLPWYPVINCLTFLQLHDLEPHPSPFFTITLHPLRSCTLRSIIPNYLYPLNKPCSNLLIHNHTATTTYCLLCARHHPKHFTCIISVNLQQHCKYHDPQFGDENTETQRTNRSRQSQTKEAAESAWIVQKH